MSLMGKGGGVPGPACFARKQEHPKAELCQKVFSAMATAEERTLLLPPSLTQAGCAPKPDSGARRKTVALLEALVVARLNAGACTTSHNPAVAPATLATLAAVVTAATISVLCLQAMPRLAWILPAT